MAGRIIKTVPTLIVEGLKQTEAAPLVTAADLSWLTDEDELGVPLAPYRRLLDAVLHGVGPMPILQAGQALRGLSHPILFVLLNTANPEILIEKEARLARFIHSRHRVDIVDCAPRQLVLEHTSAGEAPRPSENLASCGQHIVLFEEIGCRGLTLHFPYGREPDRPVYEAGRFVPMDATDGFHSWRFTWDRFEPTRRPMAGLDDVLLGTLRGRKLNDDADPVAEVEYTLLQDLGRTWKIGAVAEHLGRSTRTLQRQLSGRGNTFTDIVLRVRTSEAARLLERTELSVTEIGYICGFADTAHFSRSFKRRYDVAPSRWAQR